MPDLSILIVSWNSRALLARCLHSLDPGAAEVIVVDNASVDGSADLVAREFPTVRLVRQTTNRGFAAGVNRAAELATTDRFLLLNSDTEATPGAAAALARVLGERPACGAVAGRLVDAAGMPQDGFNVRRFPTLATWAVDLLLVDKIWPGNPVTRRYHARDVADTEPVSVEQPAAACLMVRRQAFEQLGGLDERFFPAWFEDVDFCLRLRRAGWDIVWLPNAVFRHTGEVAMRELGLAAFSRIWYRNLERYVDKHHGTAARAIVKLLITVGMLERALISLAAGRAKAAGAYLAVLRGTLTGWHW